MSSHRPSRKDIEKLCAGIGPEDGIDPRYVRNSPGDRQINRKTLQLCSQVSRTLMEVLAGCRDEVLRDLEVVSVSPAAGAGRFLVSLQPSLSSPARSAANIQDHLGRAAGLLRNEVAAAIHRRKTPELIFQVLDRPGPVE
jgi:ribosome-binding factor A